MGGRRQGGFQGSGWGPSHGLTGLLLIAFIVPGLPARDWPPVEDHGGLASVRIASGSERLVGRFFSPTRLDARKRYPAVLLTQSFPVAARSAALMNASEAPAAHAEGECEDLPYRLRAAGMSCLVHHLRGCGGSTGSADPSEAEGDVAAGLSWLRAQAGVDPDRIAAVGLGFGGAGVLRSALRGLGQAFEASVAICVDPVSFISGSIPL